MRSADENPSPMVPINMTAPYSYPLCFLLACVAVLFTFGLQGSESEQAAPETVLEQPATLPAHRVIHAVVALCDNRKQGIVPVSESLGNGQNPRENLYWGAMYGVKTFLSRSAEWRILELDRRPEAPILDHALFQLRGDGQDTYLFAEAFDGAEMTAALERFFSIAAGQHAAVFEFRPRSNAVKLGSVETTHVQRLSVGRSAELVVFVGHNGLMDDLRPSMPAYVSGPHPGKAIILACRSRDYFLDGLRAARCEPLLTTTGLMAPEAYVLDAAVRSWASGATATAIHDAASAAYAKYQRCSKKAADRLFHVGW